MPVDIGWDNMTDFLGEGLISSMFGSPDLAGIFLLAVIVFIMLKMRVAIDGIFVIVGFTVFILMAVGVWQMLFIPMIIGMLFIIGLAMLKVFKR